MFYIDPTNYLNSLSSLFTSTDLRALVICWDLFGSCFGTCFELLGFVVGYVFWIWFGTVWDFVSEVFRICIGVYKTG